jgi:hypothetical protein
MFSTDREDFIDSIFLMPTLRGHHLICLHFFNGEGYDQRFVDNLRDVMNAVESQGLTIGSGGDDVCGKCRYLKDGTCQHSEYAEAEIRKMDRKALTLLGLSAGDSVTWNSITNRVPDIFADWFREYCSDCEWLPVCEKNSYFRTLRYANS